MDSTVKPLYGHQEGAVLGYNPKKPGRPSHVYHTYTMAGLRLVLDVDVAAGNQHASNHAAPGLVGAPGSHSARLLAVAAARRQRLRYGSGDAQGRAKRASLSVQAAPYR